MKWLQHLEFENPIAQEAFDEYVAQLNEANARAVRNLLKAENIVNVRVYSLLVCPDPTTQFKYTSDGIVRVENLLSYLRDVPKVTKIDFRDVSNVANAIRKYRVVPPTKKQR